MYSREQINSIRRNPDGVRRLYYEQAISAETSANKKTWVSCLWCWKIAGKYQEGGVKGLAADLGKSDDTVYDRAHAYSIFNDICLFDGGRYRSLAFQARRSQYITWSHFRALWDAKKTFNLDMEIIIHALMDVVFAEGDITSRGLDTHIREKYGVQHNWEYYAKRVTKEMLKCMNAPGVPRRIRKDMKSLSKKIGSNNTQSQ